MSCASFKDDMYEPAFITPWSAVHLLFGFVSYCGITTLIPNFYIAVVITFVLHNGYEIKDMLCADVRVDENDNNSLAVHENTTINSIGDNIAFLLGMTIAVFTGHNSIRAFMVGIVLYIIAMVTAHATGSD